MSDEPRQAPGLAYARELHSEVKELNRDLYSRAQTVLTLDGVVIGVFGAVISSSPDDVAKTVERSTTLTSVLAILAIAALACSVVSSFMALYSRHRTTAVPIGRTGVDNAHLWFYAKIAEVRREDFLEAASTVDDERETRIRLLQVATMAPIMRRRANWVNTAYALSALGFVLFVAAGVDYLAELPSG
jgi:Family of unknown function (DUF5706)